MESNKISASITCALKNTIKRNPNVGNSYPIAFKKRIIYISTNTFEFIVDDVMDFVKRPHEWLRLDDIEWVNIKTIKIRN